VTPVWDVLLSSDAALLGAILALPHPEWLNRVFEAASLAGIGGAVWILFAVLLAAARRITWRDLVMVVAAIALVHLVVDVVLKPAVARTRPVAAASPLGEDERPQTPSFPSGHAANATAAALVLTRRWPRHRAVVWTAAALMGVARVYLGVHYPADAVAGALTGLACGYLVLHAPSVRKIRGAP
jgi:undecaprenyl-diphosphatase